MPTPAHTRVTWSGIFGTAAAPLEIWQMGLKFNAVLTNTDAKRALQAEALKAAWEVNVASACTSLVRLTRTRVASIGPNGLVLQDGDGAYEQADVISDSPGSGTGGTWPLQTALCVSLTTARSGPTGMGRFFLPQPAVTLGTDTRISQPNTANIALRMKGFLDACNDAFDSGSGPGVDAGRVVVASSKGYLSDVTGVRVGRVLDTQRRRRGDLVEEYVALPVVA